MTFHVGMSNICKGSEAPWGTVCFCKGYRLGGWRCGESEAGIRPLGRAQVLSSH